MEGHDETSGARSRARAAASARRRRWRFWRDGFRVVLAGRHRERLEEVAQAAAARRRSLASRADVTDPAQVRALFDATREKFGRLDVLFNNAGVGTPFGVHARGPAPSSNGATVIDTNLTGAFLCTQQAFRLMKDQDAARRAHHQQRLDLGARAAREFRAVYGVEARHHGPDQVHLARWPQVRHRLRADRHRQCADRARSRSCRRPNR